LEARRRAPAAPLKETPIIATSNAGKSPPGMTANSNIVLKDLPASMNTPANLNLTGYILPIGNEAVGKTTVALVLNPISRNEAINPDLISKVHKTNNLEFEYIFTRQVFGDTQYSITLQFLIPPGQKETEGDPAGRSFEKVIEIYGTSLRRVDVVLFTYALTKHESFKDLAYWVNNAGSLMNDATHFILLGTHLDQKEAREVSEDEIKEELENLRTEIQANRPAWAGKCTHLEVSCTSGENLGVLLRYLAASIVSMQQG
jgi:GTPase SAR1 family protein